MRIVIAGIACALAMFAVTPSTPIAHADVNAYPCTYPGQGTQAEVLVAGGQFCDGPTEINLSHYHCEGGGTNFGAFGLAGQNGISLGALGSGGIGGNGCSWRCPDNTLAPQPNPIGAYHQFIDVRTIIRRGTAFCTQHLAAAGPTSELVLPTEGDPTDMPSDLTPAYAPPPERHHGAVIPEPGGALPIPQFPVPSLP